MNYNRFGFGRPITILSIKTKGGVGGSHLAMATATVLRMSACDAFTTVLTDLDGSTGTAITKMGERDDTGQLLAEQSVETGVVPIDLFDKGERGRLFDLTEMGDRFIVLDGPAASLNMFRDLTENLGAIDWADHNRACGRDLVVMIPITPHLSSIVTVREAIDTFGTDATYVAVRSMRGCTAADYVLWDEPEFKNKYGNTVSGQSKACLAGIGGSVLDMPSLNAAVLARAEALQLNFAEAITSSLLRAHERISIRKWLQAWTLQLDTIRGPLGLDNSFSWNIS